MQWLFNIFAVELSCEPSALSWIILQSSCHFLLVRVNLGILALLLLKRLDIKSNVEAPDHLQRHCKGIQKSWLNIWTSWIHFLIH